MVGLIFFFQAEDGIRDLVRSRGLGDVYKRQPTRAVPMANAKASPSRPSGTWPFTRKKVKHGNPISAWASLNLSLIHI